MLLQHVIDIIESVAPLSYQEEWDNSGLQVGNPSANVEAALLTIDVTESVVDEAVSRGCQLIISHHPLLFRGLKSVCGRTPQERIVEKAIQHNIAIYSSHTAMDKGPLLTSPSEGRNIVCNVSGKMAEKIGVRDYRVLVGEEHGLGVIGEWQGTFEQLLARVKEVFQAPVLRYVPMTAVRSNSGSDNITMTAMRSNSGSGAQSNSGSGSMLKVALCGGAAAEFIDEAVAQGADVYISADMKYHEMQAAEGRIALIDLDHWHSEQYTREIFAELLEGKIKTHVAESDRSPVRVY